MSLGKSYKITTNSLYCNRKIIILIKLFSLVLQQIIKMTTTCATSTKNVTKMMTSSNGNLFCITGHLCGQFIGDRWIPSTNGQWRGALMSSLICTWINGWVNNGEAGDLKYHRIHHDITVRSFAANHQNDNYWYNQQGKFNQKLYFHFIVGEVYFPSGSFVVQGRQHLTFNASWCELLKNTMSWIYPPCLVEFYYLFSCAPFKYIQLWVNICCC